MRPGAVIVIILLGLGVLPGCGTGPPLKVYTGLDLPDEHLALLDWSACALDCVYAIDGMKLHRFPAQQAKLLPGRHAIRYGTWFGVSALYGRTSVTYEETAVLDMKAGHIYAIHFEKQQGWVQFSDDLWIEDQKTGEVMHGVRPGSP